MMIDAHTHVFPKWMEYLTRTGLFFGHLKKLKSSATIDSLEQQAENLNLSKCFVFPLPVIGFFGASNKYIESLKEDNLVKFGCVSKKEDVVKLKAKGFRGIKIHQHFQRTSINRLKGILDTCEREGMIITIHVSRSLFKHESFSHEVISLLKNRTNPIILAHLSATEQLKDTDVFFDTALRTADDVKKAITLVGNKRILFGSDFPVTNIHEELSKLDVLSATNRERILDKNVGTILKQIN